MNTKIYTYILIAIALLGLYFQYRTMKAASHDCGCGGDSGKIIE